MAGTKFSGFTAGVSPVDATTFLVGYESVAGTNNRYDKAEIAGWLTSGAGAISTFYVADGTLSAARTVTMGTYNLAFASTTAGQEVSFGQNVKVSGQGYTEQHDSLAGNATVNWNDGNVQYIQLASGANTFTPSNPQDGATYILQIKQPSSGAAGTVTWGASVKWPAATAPTLTTTNDYIDVVTLIYNGTTTHYYAAATLDLR